MNEQVEVFKRISPPGAAGLSEEQIVSFMAGACSMYAVAKEHIKVREGMDRGNYLTMKAIRDFKKEASCSEKGRK